MTDASRLIQPAGARGGRRKGMGEPFCPDQVTTLGRPQETSLVRVHLLLLPGFDLHDVAVISDVFCAAEAYAGRRLFQVHLLGCSAGPVTSSTGVACTVAGTIGSAANISTLLLLAGDLNHISNRGAVLARLIELAGQGVRMGGVDGGAILLTLAGLMKGRVSVSTYRTRCLPPGIKDVTFCRSACTFNSDTFSCAGGMGTFSLALRAVEETIGSSAAFTVAAQMGYNWEDWHAAGSTEALWPAQTDGSETLRRILREFSGKEPTHAKLREVLARVGTSRRQAQRLFRDFIGQTPSQYIQSAQLRRARELLIGTLLTIKDIAACVGFATGSALGRAYKKAYGASPRQHRIVYHVVPGPLQFEARPAARRRQPVSRRDRAFQ